MRATLASAIVLPSLLMGACRTVPADNPRAAPSSLGCMQAALTRQDLAGLPDKQAHCIAAGTIARYCSVIEAHLAAVGKEIRDALGPGDADANDLRASEQGIACARGMSANDDLRQCCMSAVQDAPK